MGVRQVRLADEIRDIVSRCFMASHLEDPRLKYVVITHVKLSADLQLASVYYRIIEVGSVDEKDVIKGLDSCKGYLKRMISSKIKLRRVPDLRFFFDESIEYGSHIEGILTKAKE
jgi:ribosome-binding factor A